MTLAETTPVAEASDLQDDLRRAGIEPYGWIVNATLAGSGIAAGTIFRSPDPSIEFDHTSLIATVVAWCGVDPGSAGLGDRVAAPLFDWVLTEAARSDVPTFTLPDGDAEQGSSCWITDDTSRLSVGVMRTRVARSTTVAELEAEHGARARPGRQSTRPIGPTDRPSPRNVERCPFAVRGSWPQVPLSCGARRRGPVRRSGCPAAAARSPSTPVVPAAQRHPRHLVVVEGATAGERSC